jgi:L-threonylcarbamoyladenylate synthase
MPRGPGAYHRGMLPQADQIEKAAALLNAGELVAFPTETVYGLGGDADDTVAVARIFAAKGRPASHPLIVHVSNLASARRWSAAMPEAAERLAEAFWPGPLTLVVPKAAQVLPAVTGGQGSVALRAPAHPVARALLAAFGRGIAAPSANRYGRISPTRAVDVREELGDRVAMVLDGGDCEVGLESTIVACLDGRVTLLRPGAVSRLQIADVIGAVAAADSSAPRTPGGKRSHYAPQTPLVIVAGADLNAEIERALRQGERIAVLTHAVAPVAPDRITWRPLPAESSRYGRALYATLRDLDRAGASRILVESVPANEAWAAVADRLGRAAGAGTDAGVPDAT